VALHAALCSGGYIPWLQPPHIPGRLTRPGDVFGPVGDIGLGVKYNATIVSSLLGPIMASTARTPGYVITAHKSLLYTSICSTVEIRFVPLAQETFVGLSRNALFRMLSVAIQRSIARVIIDRAGRLSERAPLVPLCPS
jgi:hypothetical protein